MRLDGKRALITGGASGIGLAMAERFAEVGARLFLADWSPDALATAEKDLRAKGHEVATALCDVTREEAVMDAFAALDRAYGGLDVVVANAGMSANKPTLQMSAEDFDRTMDVNVRGVFFTLREAGRRMVPAGGGSMVAISSIWGVAAGPERLAYTASKHAVVGMTKVLASEWAHAGVRVNAIGPGFTATPMIRAIVQAGKLDTGVLEARTPMGRLARPEEMAELALFLASDASSFITGQVIVADGGWTAYGFHQPWLDAR